MRRFFPSRILPAVLPAAMAATLWAQVQIQIQPQQLEPMPPLELSPAQGTMLEINPDAESLLARAREYVEAGQYREALLLAQHVVDNFPDALTAADAQLYIPARLAVRQMIRAMPPEGLNLYRLTADGEALALVGGQAMGNHDEASLQQVVNRYFLSSIGDEAAYMLACLRIDRGQFRSAAALLRLIQTAHPDPSVDPAAINARLTFALAQSGATPGQDEPLATMGSAGLPRDGQPTLWAVRWQVRAPLPEPDSALVVQPGNAVVSSNRPQLLRRWRDAGWQPTAQAALADDKLIFKSAESLMCADLDTGQILWQTPNVEISPVTPDHPGAGLWPSNAQEIVLFGDRIGRALSVIDGVVYHIEGHQALSGVPQGVAVWINGRPVQMSVGNRLAAFDPAAWQVKWRATIPSRMLDEPGAVAQPRAPVGATRFLCPPVTTGNQLLVVVEDNGEYHLVALNPSDGRMVWRRFLCAVSPGYAPPWAPVGLMIDGETAYIAPGCGLVLAVDASDGSIRWATGYPRFTPDNQQLAPQSINQPWMRGLATWQDNTLRTADPDAPGLIVAAADSPMIQLIDRDTGRIIRSIDPTPHADPESPFNYVLGVHDDAILVGGTRALAAFDVRTGQLRWRCPLEGGSTGRAVLTADAVFASAGHRIVRIDPRTGKWLADVNVTNAVDVPLGHLYCDPAAPGHLLALGMDQAVALVDAQQELERLAPRIARKDAEAYLARSALYEQLGQPDESLEDLRQAHEHAGDETTRRQAGDRLFELLLARAGQNPSEATSLLEQAQELASDQRQKLRVEMATARQAAAAGRRDVAVKQLRELALRAEPMMIPADDSGSPGLEADVAELAAAELRRLLAKDGRMIADQLDALARTAPAAPVADQPAQLVAAYRTALAHPGTLKSLEAARTMLAAGVAEQFGQVELALRQIVEQAAPIAPVAAAAHRLIAQAYQQRQFAADAAEQWSQLAQRFPQVTPTGATADAASLAKAQLAELQTVLTSYADGQQLGDPPYVLQWRTNDMQGQLFTLADGQSMDATALLRDRVLTYVPNWNRIICRNADDGDELWSKQLAPDAAPPADRGAYRRFHGGVDAHVLVVRTPTRIAAYDLVDGAQLWSDSPDGAPLLGQRQPTAPPRGLYYTLDTGNGVYVEQIRRSPQHNDQLRGLDLVDGRELWRRSFAEHSIDGVWILGDYVVVAVDNRAELWVCQPRTGKLVRSIRLHSTEPDSYIAWTRYGLLYQVRGGLNFAPLDGGESWSIPVAGLTVRPIGVVADRYVVVLWSGFISVIDTQRGVEMWKQRHDTTVRSIFDAAADADATTLIVLGRSGANQIVGLVMELATGKLISRIDAGPSAGLPLPNTQTPARSGAIIPILVRDRPNSQHFAVRFYRRADGRALDRSALSTPDDDNQLENATQSPIIRAGRLIVPTLGGLLAFGSSGESFEQPPIDTTPAAQTENEQPPDQVIDWRGMHIELRDGVIEVRTDGGVMRAGNIQINQLEIRQVDGRLQILENGQPVVLPGDTPQPAEDQQETPSP